MSSPQKTTEAKLAAFHDEDTIDKSYDLQMLSRLWPFISPHVRYVVFSLLGLFSVAGINLVKLLL